MPSTETNRGAAAPRAPRLPPPIVAAFSADSAAREPVEFGLAACRLTGAPLIIVTVAHGDVATHHALGSSGDAPHGAHADALQHLERELKQRGVGDVEMRIFEDRSTARGLAHAMDALEPELIVLGPSHRGKLGAVLLGATTERVIHDSACPVAIVPHDYARPENGVQVIGAAYAPTPEGREAVAAAAGLARAAGVEVRIIAVAEEDHAADQSHGLTAAQHHDVSPQEEKAERRRASAEADVAEAVAELVSGVKYEIDVLVNDPATGLIAASKFVDLLVMGSRALAPKRALMLGSVSRKVADHCACPLLVLPRGGGAKREALLADAAAQAARRP
jgi:nucleotide-binding universal stress UspA family protein